MYPNLSYILHALGIGTPDQGVAAILQTFGLLLAVTFLTSAYILTLDIRQREKENPTAFPGSSSTRIVGKMISPFELILSGLFALFFGLKLGGLFSDASEAQQDIVAYLFSFKGNWLIGGIAAVAYMAYLWWDSNKNKLDKPKTVDYEIKASERVGDIILVAAVSGIIGAKLFDVIEHLDRFWEDPVGMLISGSGLTMYGGLILGFAGVYWYIRKHKISGLHMMDASAPVLMLGYGIGRIGCQLSGDGDWGIVNDSPKPDWMSFLPDWMWGMTYPNNVAQAGPQMPDCPWEYCNELAQPHYPTPFYETILAVIIFAILWSLRKRLKVAGMLFMVYLVLNGMERFFIERIRVNERYDWAYDLSQAQMIALGLVLAGLIGGFVLWKRHKKINATTTV